MENQHRQIRGYRELEPREIDTINDIKSVGETVAAIVRRVRETEHVDQRWASIGETHLQQGLMALTRAIAKPTFFAFMLAVSFYGCSSVQEVGIAVERNTPGSAPHYEVLRDHVSGRLFGQNLQTGVLLHCTYKFTSEEMAILREKYGESTWYTGCTEKQTPVIAGQSTMSQLQGPVSAAFLGTGIGAGLAFSGDSVTNNNSTSSQGGAGGKGGNGGNASITQPKKRW